MAFGDNAKKAKQSAENRQNKPVGGDDVYFPVVDGPNLFRLFPDDDVILFREFWMEVPVIRMKDDVEVIEPQEKPIILSVFNPASGFFEAAEPSQDPISGWYYGLTEDERKALKKTIRTRFAINVLNRNLVSKNPDGTVVADEDGEPMNKVQILVHSGGKEGDKHVLQSITDCVADMRNVKGKKIAPHEADLKIVRAGKGFDTRYSVNVGYNQEPVDFSPFVKYDLTSHYKPFPFEALRLLMDGDTDWSTIKKQFNISSMPSKFVDDSDVPF